MIVSKEELSAVINQFQSKVIWFLIVAAIPLTFSAGIAVTIIRNDIKDSRTVAHSESVALKHYVDSLHHDDQLYNKGQFTDIRNQILNLPQPKTTIIRQTPKPIGVGLYTQRIINGQLGWFKVN